MFRNRKKHENDTLSEKTINYGISRNINFKILPKKYIKRKQLSYLIENIDDRIFFI